MITSFQRCGPYFCKLLYLLRVIFQVLIVFVDRDVRCGLTSFIKKHFREVFNVKKFDSKKGKDWIDDYKDLCQE